MADKKIGIVLGVSGEQQSAQAIEQVAQRGATAFERLQTTVSRTGNAAEFAEGKVKKLGRGVNDAAGAVQLMSPLLGGLGANFGTLAGTIGNVSDVFGTLSSILLKNPIGLAALALTAGVTAFAAFGQSADAATVDVKQLDGALKDLKAQIDAVNSKRIEVTGGSVGVLARDAADKAQRRRDLEAEIAAQEAILAKASAATSTGLGNQSIPGQLGPGTPTRLRKRIDDLKTELASVTSQLDALAEAKRKLAQAEAENVNEFEGRGEALAAIGVERKRAADAAATRSAEEAAAAQERLRSSYVSLSSSLDPVLRAQRDLEQSTTILEQAQRAGIISTDELGRMKELLARRSYEASEAGQAEARAIADGVAAAERAITPLERYEQQLDNIQRAVNANKISEDQAAKARDKVRDELDKSTGEAKDAAKNARELGLAFSSAFEDAIVGGKGFREVISGLGRDLLRVYIRRQLTEPLLEFFSVASKGGSGSAASSGGGILGSILGGFGGLFGGGSAAGSPAGDGGGIMGGSDDFLSSLWPFAGGGIMTSAGPLPLRAYAGGGIADRPQFALFGEGRQPEAFVPLPDGRTIPVTLDGGGAQRITVSNHFVIDARGADTSVDKRIRLAIAEAEPSLVEASIRGVQDRANRGGSFAKSVGRRRGR